MSKIVMEIEQKGDGNQVNLRIRGLSVYQIYPMFLALIEVLQKEGASADVILGSLFAAIVSGFSKSELDKYIELMETGEKEIWN